VWSNEFLNPENITHSVQIPVTTGLENNLLTDLLESSLRGIDRDPR